MKSASPLLTLVASTPVLLSAWGDVLAAAQGRGVLSGEVRSFRDDAIARLEILQRDLLRGSWRPGAVRQFAIPGDRQRTLTVSSVRDRVVERAMAEVLGERIDCGFSLGSFGYRKGLGVADAVNSLRDAMQAGWSQVARTDVAQAFDSLPRRSALSALGDRIDDGPALDVVSSLLGRLDDQGLEGRGIAQGSALSPLLLNVSLDGVDRAIEACGYVHVRYADDFAILSRDVLHAQQSLDLVGDELARVGLAVNPSKTAIVETSGGFEFLGQRVLPPGRPTSADRHHHPNRMSVYVTGGKGLARLSNGAVVVERSGVKEVCVKLPRVQQLVLTGRTGISAPLIHELSRRGVDLVLLDDHGGFVGRLARRRSGNVEVKRAQYRTADDPVSSVAIARGLVTGKLLNMRAGVQREARRSGQDLQGASRTARTLERYARSAARAGSVHEAMGFEGAGAREYFSWLAETVDSGWGFLGRNRRPPRDPINAMLSFAYTLLSAEMIGACEAAWLDPDLGFLHSPRWGRPSLALDLMEEWRPVLVDCAVLRVARSGLVTPDDFEDQGDAGCRMTQKAKKALIAAYEKRMLTCSSSPAARGRRPYRELITAHAGSMAAALLEGEPERYQGYRWR